MEKNREFHFTQKHFNDIKELIIEHTGISLSDAKDELVYGRIARRLRALKLKSFDDYCSLLRENPEQEFGHFINAITTNLTAFFREDHHFVSLKEEILPKLLHNRRSNRKLRIWSAGCSTGEEPYSISIALLESIKDLAQWDVRILATDIDTNVLDKASEGVYSLQRIVGLPEARQERWFQKGKAKQEGQVRVKQEVRELINFKQLNLMGKWPIKRQFDVIFCRNVLIYFNKDTQGILIDRYANVLKEDGYLFLGHSETLHGVSTRFDLLGKSSYRKCA